MSKVRREESLGQKEHGRSFTLRKKKNLQRNSQGVFRKVKGKPEQWGVKSKVRDLEVAEAFN